MQDKQKKYTFQIKDDEGKLVFTGSIETPPSVKEEIPQPQLSEKKREQMILDCCEKAFEYLKTFVSPKQKFDKLLDENKEHIETFDGVEKFEKILTLIQEGSILLDFDCSLGGNPRYISECIHWHGIQIYSFINQKEGFNLLSRHSSSGDGTLCKPNYYEFLTQKISGFLKEIPKGAKVYIDERILEIDSFYKYSGRCSQIPDRYLRGQED